MAENSRHSKSPKELSEEIERSRERVAQELRNLRAELDLPKQIRRSFRRQPVLWIAAATAVGLIITLKLGRRQKPQVSNREIGKPASKLLEAGFILGLVRIAANLFKPFIVNFVSDKVGRYARSEHSRKRW
jgi:hypothetical protein